MKVIGITGGIGSGKSTVTQCLADIGLPIIDADTIAWEFYAPNTQGWRDVVAEFGEEIVAEDGGINRKKLGEIVFSNPDDLARLNAIVHPGMYNMMKDRISDYEKQGEKIVVIEAAVMIEANWTPLVDELWVAVASEESVIARLKNQRGMSEEQILSRIHAQLSNEVRSKHADKVINNDGSPEELREKVKALWEELHQ